MKKFLYSAALMLCGVAPAWAGNVTTKLSGGTLFIYGDNGHNSLNIVPLGNGEVALVGYDSAEGEPTTVNGKVDPVVLTKWTKGLYIYMYNGNDRVSIPYGSINGPLHVDLGNGNDGLTIGVPFEDVPDEEPDEEVIATTAQASNGFGYATTISGTLFILGGSGRDSVAIASTSVGGKATADLGNDNDQFFAGNYGYFDDESFVGPCLFKDSVVVVPGRGFDVVGFVGDEIKRDLTVDDSGDGLDCYVYDTQIAQNAFAYGTNAADSIEFYNCSIRSLLKILAKDGIDSIYVDFCNCGNIDLYGGSGNDTVSVYETSTNKLATFLENGNDFLYVYYSRIKTLLSYGGSGNDLLEFVVNQSSDAKVWGDAGTDTYRVNGNVFTKQNQYTIEKRETVILVDD